MSLGRVRRCSAGVSQLRCPRVSGVHTASPTSDGGRYLTLIVLCRSNAPYAATPKMTNLT